MEKTKSCKRKMRIAIGILLLEFAYMLFMGIGGVHATDETLPTVDGKFYVHIQSKIQSSRKRWRKNTILQHRRMIFMIIDKIGDILHTEADVICHQVNCKGVMGAGLAKQIRNQLLSEEQYRTYQEICREYGRANLGKVIRMKTDTYQVYNLFGEDIPTGAGVDTIYAALYKALVCTIRK